MEIEERLSIVKEITVGKTERILLMILALGIWALFSCGKHGPEPIAYGKDSCTYCRMIVSDRKFGAELVTTKGKILKFDSIECLAGYVNKTREINGHSLWVVDYSNLSKFVDATRASYLVSEKIHSPMGLNISAFEQKDVANRMVNNYGGRVVSWNDVLDYVQQKWK